MWREEPMNEPLALAGYAEIVAQEGLIIGWILLLSGLGFAFASFKARSNFLQWTLRMLAAAGLILFYVLFDPWKCIAAAASDPDPDVVHWNDMYRELGIGW